MRVVMDDKEYDGFRRFSLEEKGLLVKGFRFGQGRIMSPVAMTRYGAYPVAILTLRLEAKIAAAISRADQRQAQGDTDWANSLVLR